MMSRYATELVERTYMMQGRTYSTYFHPTGWLCFGLPPTFSHMSSFHLTMRHNKGSVTLGNLSAQSPKLARERSFLETCRCKAMLTRMSFG